MAMTISPRDSVRVYGGEGGDGARRGRGDASLRGQGGRRRIFSTTLFLAVLPSCRLAVLPSCRLAVLPSCRLAVSTRLARCESIASRIASGIDAGVGWRLIDSITSGEAAWATGLLNLPFRGARVLLGIDNAVAVTGQILGQKKTVDRGLSARAADAVRRIERIEYRLGLRDVAAAIAVAVDATPGAGRVDRASGGKPNGQAGWVPRVMDPYTIRRS
jgi:hypothetical protein